MVKIGFICEGNADKVILNSDRFRDYLYYKFSLEYSEEEILPSGGKSYIKTQFVPLVQNLQKKGAEYIFILVDQDDKTEQRKNNKHKPVDCPPAIVAEILNHRNNKNYNFENIIFVIMTREMEAWFLADEKLGFDCQGRAPEEILNPSDLLSSYLETSCHSRIAKKLKDRFSLQRAAVNAPSAKRFINKLKQISQS